MFRFIALSALAVLVAGQHRSYNSDPKTAAILTEQRYQSGDGKFGAAYTQEDGINFKEETDANGDRRGSYSYIDPTGQKRTVSYTAGKNGFVASGDHLPVAPAAPQAPAPAQQYQAQPQYHQQPQQQYHQQPQQQYQAKNYDNGNEDDGQYDERYNDPSFSGNNNGPAPVAYNKPAPVQQPQYNYNPQPNYQQPQQQQQNQYNNYQHQPSPQYTTTDNPHRFQPPGKLQLNRTPDGYSYSFNKV